MESQEAPKPVLTMVQEQKFFEEEFESLRSLLAEASKLKPTFSENVCVLEKMNGFIATLKQDMQEAFNDIGAISEVLKKQKEKNKKHKKLPLEILTAVKEENKNLVQEIKQLSGSVALCTLGLDTVQNVFNEQKTKINELEQESSKLVTLELHLITFREIKKEITNLQAQISYNSKIAFTETDVWKSHTQILGVLSVVNLFAIFWIWWHMHRA